MISKTHPGHGGKPYDSQAEATASHYLATLGLLRDNTLFPIRFTDPLGESFGACPDFLHAGLNLTLELKSAPLNPATSKSMAESRLLKQQDWRNGQGKDLLMIDRLNLAFNHSLIKNKITQQTLKPQNHIIAFTSAPTLEDAHRYIRNGIVFIPLSEVGSYTNFVRLNRAGRTASYHLSYSIEGLDEPLGFSIGTASPAELTKQFVSINRETTP